MGESLDRPQIPLAPATHAQPPPPPWAFESYQTPAQWHVKVMWVCMPWAQYSKPSDIETKPHMGEVSWGSSACAPRGSEMRQGKQVACGAQGYRRALHAWHTHIHTVHNMEQTEIIVNIIHHTEGAEQHTSALHGSKVGKGFEGDTRTALAMHLHAQGNTRPRVGCSSIQLQTLFVLRETELAVRCPSLPCTHHQTQHAMLQ